MIPHIEIDTDKNVTDKNGEKKTDQSIQKARWYQWNNIEIS